MIQYKCDLCCKEIDKKRIRIIEQFPRLVSVNAVDCMGSRVSVLEDVAFKETHLCQDCCCKIAGILQVVTPEIKEDKA